MSISQDDFCDLVAGTTVGALETVDPVMWVYFGTAAGAEAALLTGNPVFIDWGMRAGGSIGILAGMVQESPAFAGVLDETIGVACNQVLDALTDTNGVMVHMDYDFQVASVQGVNKEAPDGQDSPEGDLGENLDTNCWGEDFSMAAPPETGLFPYLPDVSDAMAAASGLMPEKREEFVTPAPVAPPYCEPEGSRYDPPLP